MGCLQYWYRPGGPGKTTSQDHPVGAVRSQANQYRARQAGSRGILESNRFAQAEACGSGAGRGTEQSEPRA